MAKNLKFSLAWTTLLLELCNLGFILVLNYGCYLRLLHAFDAIAVYQMFLHLCLIFQKSKNRINHAMTHESHVTLKNR